MRRAYKQKLKKYNKKGLSKKNPWRWFNRHIFGATHGSPPTGRGKPVCLPTFQTAPLNSLHKLYIFAAAQNTARVQAGNLVQGERLIKFGDG